MSRRGQLSPGQIAELELLLKRDDIPTEVMKFAGRPISNGVRSRRSQSYDHCYNYFADIDDLKADLEKSCAVLGFYLASWGMYRGSAYLQRETNSGHLARVVGAIQSLRAALAYLDLNRYDEDNIETVLRAYQAIDDALQIKQRSRVTIVTKIMVAAFGCIPAFDRNFTSGFRKVLGAHAKFPSGRMDKQVLQLLGAFYRANQSEIDRLHADSRTVAFGTDEVTEHRLTRAKIVDMYCYQLGAG